VNETGEHTDTKTAKRNSDTEQEQDGLTNDLGGHGANPGHRLGEHLANIRQQGCDGHSSFTFHISYLLPRINIMTNFAIKQKHIKLNK